MDIHTKLNYKEALLVKTECINKHDFLQNYGQQIFTQQD